MYEVRKLNDEEIEEAILLCFDILVKNKSFKENVSSLEKYKRIYTGMVLKDHYYNNTTFYGLFLNNEIIGVLQCLNNYIMQLVIKDEYQGKGLGTFLLKRLVDINNRDLVVDAAVEAIGFYEKNGFFKTTELKEDKPCVKMKKIIKKG